MATARLLPSGDIENLFALAGVGDDLAFRNDETISGRRRDQEPALRIEGEDGDDILVLVHVDKNADRLAVAPPARQPRRLQPALRALRRAQPFKLKGSNSRLKT